MNLLQSQLNKSLQQTKNFLNPRNISLLIILNDFSQQNSGIDLDTPLANFLSRELLTDPEPWLANPSLSQFTQHLLTQTKDPEVVKSYLASLRQLASLNDLFRYLSNLLRNMRTFRNGNAEQGSLIDLFIRKSLLALAILKFDDLIKMYDQFNEFKCNPNRMSNKEKNEIPIELQELEESIANLGLDCNNIQQEMKLPINWTNNNRLFLNAQLSITEKNQNKMTSNLHAFFDKQIGHLISAPNPSLAQTQHINRIHHAPINLAFNHLQMGLMDEALSGISEGLRQAQNNTETVSLNQCVQMLYVLGEYLGKLSDAQEIAVKSVGHNLRYEQHDGVFRGALFLAKIHQQLYLNRGVSRKQGNWLQIANSAMALIQKQMTSVHGIDNIDKYRILLQQVCQQQFIERYGQVSLGLELGERQEVNRAERVSRQILQQITLMMMSESMGQTVEMVRELRVFNRKRGLHRENIKLGLVVAQGYAMNRQYIHGYERAWGIYQTLDKSNEVLLAQQARLVMTMCATGLNNYAKALAYLRKCQKNYMDTTIKAQFYYLYAELLLLIIHRSSLSFPSRITTYYKVLNQLRLAMYHQLALHYNYSITFFNLKKALYLAARVHLILDAQGQKGSRQQAEQLAKYFNIVNQVTDKLDNIDTLNDDSNKQQIKIMLTQMLKSELLK